VSNLLTLADVRNRFPADAGGYRPSERVLRETIRDLGCYIKLGRAIYLTEEHWKQLLAGLQRRTPSQSPQTNFRALKELSHKFENRYGLKRLPED
jgi:hypothetical protein